MAIEGRDDGAAGGRIRLGMVGGGEGAFIGAVHRIAARLDDHYELRRGRTVLDAGEGAALGRRRSGSIRDRIYGDFERWRSASGG